MGALFSTPTATPHETSNLSIQRTSNPPDDMRSLPLASTSIPSPSSSNLNPPSSILSYFSPVPSPMITHTHISPSRTDVLKVRLTLQSLGVPLELIPGILDYARFWTGCRVLSRRRLEVASEWSRPDTARNVSGRDWATGQEDDVLEERERFLRNGGDFTEWGLRDRPGEAWYLISQPVGCFSADSSSIAGHGYSAESTTEQSMAGDPESRHSDDPGPAGSSDSQLVLDLSLKKRKKRRDWVREIVIETFSKDQGWSSGGQQHYGRSSMTNVVIVVNWMKIGSDTCLLYLPALPHSAT